MNRLLTSENSLAAFPSALAEDEQLTALASVTATELMELYEKCDILAIYARIDELDGQLLDILAYDFKVDWWNANYSLDEKRATFKEYWNVKRKLGTPFACYLAISAIFQSATIREWWEYGGNPHFFKIVIEAGESLTDYNKLQRVIDGIQYYKNKRSVLESIDIDIRKKAQMYVGLAVQTGYTVSTNVSGVNPDDYVCLVDELGNYLTDENGLILFE